MVRIAELIKHAMFLTDFKYIPIKRFARSFLPFHQTLKTLYLLLVFSRHRNNKNFCFIFFLEQYLLERMKGYRKNVFLKIIKGISLHFCFDNIIASARIKSARKPIDQIILSLSGTFNQSLYIIDFWFRKVLHCLY